jgi:hypothetical protein
MRASFLSAGDPPVLAAYSAMEPKIAIDQANRRASSLRGIEREDALASARMNFVEPDAAPSEKLNRILWRAARGANTPYPAARRSVFFPMTVDLSDDDRDDANDRRIDKRPPAKSPR